MSLSEADLVLYLYDELEPAERERIERALGESAELRLAFERLKHDLGRIADVAPHRPDNYAEAVWQRIAPALGAQLPASAVVTPMLPRSKRRWMPLAMAASLAAALALGWLAGRQHTDLIDPVAAIESGDPALQRAYLQQELKAHLERTERLFTLLSNSDSLFDDPETRQTLAQGLLAANRSHQRIAVALGEPALADLLTRTEPVLAGLAHDGPGTDAESVRGWMREGDFLFQVRSASLRLDRDDAVTSTRML